MRPFWGLTLLIGLACCARPAPAPAPPKPGVARRSPAPRSYRIKSPAYAAKLDGSLRSLLTKRALYARHPDEKAFYVDPALRLHVSVQFSGDVEPLRRAGFSPKEVYGQIAYGTVNPVMLEKLARLPSVIKIEKQSEDVIQR